MDLKDIARRIADVLSQHPSGFLTDFDGTLSEIAPTPDDAVAFEGAEGTIQRLAAQVDVIGIVSGRGADDVRRHFPVNHLTVVGNHGLEWIENGERRDHPAGVAAVQAIADVMATIERELPNEVSTDGMVFENKRLSASVHFRNSSDPEAVEAALLPMMIRLATDNDLRISAGKMLVELRPLAHVSKGSALEEIVERHELKGVVFSGDDVTDIDGFLALKRLREQGVATLAVGVVSPDAHPDVIKNADVAVFSVSENVRALQLAAELLEKQS